MARFPKKEAEIAALAEQLWRGLKDNASIYPQPPVQWWWITMKNMLYSSRRDDFIAKQAAVEEATTAKEESLEELAEAMKADIRYAENTVNYDDDKLKLIGWAGKKAATPLARPSQVRLLEAPKQGDGWVFLDWKAPFDGGKPKAYKVQRRNRNNGSWSDVATAIISEATVVEQPQKQELEYRVIAVNKAGEGPQGNTVEVVL